MSRPARDGQLVAAPSHSVARGTEAGADVGAGTGFAAATGGGVADELVTLIRRCLMAYAELHDNVIQQLFAVDFLHISRSGGTSICDLAWRKGCTPPGVATRESNCWAQELHDGPKWFQFDEVCFDKRPQAVATCEGREALVRANGWRFVSNENYVEKETCIGRRSNATSASDEEGPVHGHGLFTWTQVRVVLVRS